MRERWINPVAGVKSSGACWRGLMSRSGGLSGSLRSRWGVGVARTGRGGCGSSGFGRGSLGGNMIGGRPGSFGGEIKKQKVESKKQKSEGTVWAACVGILVAAGVSLLLLMLNGCA